VSVVLTTSGSTAPTSVLAPTDGGTTFTQQTTVTDFQETGRDKKAELTIAENLPVITPTAFEVCAEQPRSNGNPNKSDCEDISINPSCGQCIPLGKTCDLENPGACCAGLACERFAPGGPFLCGCVQ
jgi:hypothetical protein